MSVAVAVAASEGLVLATDSRTIQQRDDGAAHYRVASDATEKLFSVHDRFAVATYGMAMIGDATIRGLLQDFTIGGGVDVTAYAEALGDYFSTKLSAVTPARRGQMRVEDLRWPLGFLVGGYDDAGVGQILEVAVRPANSRTQAAGTSTRNPGVVHRGQSDAIERMLEGVDTKALEKTRVSLSADDLKKLELFRYDLILPHAIDDAVRLAEFLVETQIKMQQFSDGTYANPGQIPGCGGPVRVLAVTRAAATWMRHPGTPLPNPPAVVPVLVDGARGHVRRNA